MLLPGVMVEDVTTFVATFMVVVSVEVNFVVDICEANVVVVVVVVEVVVDEVIVVVDVEVVSIRCKYVIN